jgi:hypothetical protein
MEKVTSEAAKQAQKTYRMCIAGNYRKWEENQIQLP